MHLKIGSKRNKIYRGRTLIYIFCFLVCSLWFSGVVGSSGLIQAYKLSQARRELTLRIAALESEKIKLQKTYLDLQNDRFTQEQAIREVLGFTQDNELVFEF